MKVVEYKDGNRERQILTAMILHPTVLGRISSKWQQGLFASTWANLVGQWCHDYFQKYGENPNRHIVGLFQSWAEKSEDKDTIRLVEHFLESLSDEWESNPQDIKVDYITDQAGEHFNKVKTGRILSAAQGDWDNGDVDKAIARLADFRRVEMGVGSAIDFFQDPERISSLFTHDDNSETVIHYPGAIGELFGNILELDGFVGIRAPDKVGKSWLLMDMAMRAVFSRKKTAYFQVGDMTEKQILKRFCTRSALCPIRSTEYPAKWPCFVKWPISIEHVPPIKGERGEIRQPARVEYEEKKFKRPLDYKTVEGAFDFIMTNRIKSRKPYLRISCHPNKSITVAQIRDKLKAWEIDGFFPQCCLIDYADVLAAPEGKRSWESRDLVNENWNQMRALSQELHCLVVTATQSDTEAYRKEIQDKANFSEDKRQNSHVTAMIVLNQTAGEKDAGQFRLQVVFKREEDFSPRRCVHVASCLALAHPTVRSCWEPFKNKAK